MCRFFLYCGKNRLVSEILNGDNPIYKQMYKKAYTPNSTYWVGTEDYTYMGLGILIPNNNIIKFNKSKIDTNNNIFKNKTNILLVHLRLYANFYNKSYDEYQLQPITYKDMAFMHVGTLYMNNIPNYPPKYIEDKFKEYMIVNTDSGYMFALFLYYYYNNEEMDNLDRLLISFIYMIKKTIDSSENIGGLLNNLIYNKDFVLCSRLTINNSSASAPIYYTLHNNDLMISLEPTDTKLYWIEIPHQSILLFYKNKVLIHRLDNYSITIK